MSPKATVFAAAAVVLLALDQVTKWWVRANLELRDELSVIQNFLAITHATNKGAAFSALDHFEYRLPVFYGFTAVAVVVIVQGWRELPDRDRLQAFAMGAILSGAIGNLIDRIMAGEVTDMIKVYAGFEPVQSWARRTLGTNTYPIFNIADAAIVVGVGLFVLVYIKGWGKADQTAGTPVPGPPESSASAE
ncbi:MAG: signal peptidase II [Myxococcales bacterium]|nr:signal peptidase II [Myxococcales bacterium]